MQLDLSNIKVADTLRNISLVQVKLNNTENDIVSFVEAFETILEISSINREDKLGYIIQ